MWTPFGRISTIETEAPINAEVNLFAVYQGAITMDVLGRMDRI